MRTLVLASTSPYRAALLRRLGLPFATFRPDINEGPRADEPPVELVTRLSRSKAAAARSSYPDALVIGSDQVGVLADAIVNKPGTVEGARRQLMAASGNELRFLTGLCVLDTLTGLEITHVETCTVHFRDLSESEVAEYVARENPIDCAGSFKVEGLGIALFRAVDMQDPTALEGLPMIALCAALSQHGFPALGARPL